MGFWSDKNAAEPHRKHQWYILFTRNLQQLSFAVKSCTKPSYTIENSQHVLLNYTYNFPKKLVWQPISVTMASARIESQGFTTYSVDYSLYAATNNTNKPSPVAAQPTPGAENRINNPLDNTTGIYTLSKDFLVNNFEGPIIRLQQTDSYGRTIEYWDLFNPFVTEVKFGDLSYDSEDLVEVSFTLVYDYATLGTPKLESPVAQ
jgi:hypothetical protein